MDENGNETAYSVYRTNLLARSVGGETYYYLYNGHADVTALINPNGTVAATYYYDAFGNVLESTGEADNPIRYAGYQYDDETGLYYLNARMYDPKLARFLQEDTYTGDPKDPLSLNLYTYCHNNPIVYHDPTGHKAEKKKENGFIKGLKKAGKSAYRFGKAVVGGAVGIAEGITDGVVGGFDATLLGAEAAYGKMANVFGLMDDETYKYYKEEVDRKFEPYIEYANQPNILRLVTDPIADSITSGLLLFDPKAKKEYNKIKSQKYREDFIPNLASPLQPFKYVLDSDNRHNFFSGSMTDQEMKAYMTNFYSAAMTVFGASKLLKAKPMPTDLNMSSMGVDLGQSMAISTSTVSIPPLAWAGASNGAIAVTATGIIGGRPRYSAQDGNGGTGSSKEGSSNTFKEFEAPKIYTNDKGQMTNGTYTIDSSGMIPHTNGATTGKSQFLFEVDANKAVLDGAAYADKYSLWSNGKAKVFVGNGPIGVHGGTGELTNWLNIYKTKTGFVHGAPGTP